MFALDGFRYALKAACKDIGIGDYLDLRKKAALLEASSVMTFLAFESFKWLLHKA